MKANTTEQANKFAIVRYDDFKPRTQVYYAQTAAQAEKLRAELKAKTKREWRVFGG